MEGYKIIEQKVIESEYDFFRLDIVDWNRCRPWEHPAAALRAIAPWFINQATYTIIETDLRAAPERNDWPGWKHVGNHEYFGRLYWNWFHHFQKGELHFHDAPDFSGILTYANYPPAHFWGDIGKVSALAFSESQVRMHAGDLWISIIGEHRQVIIEASSDIGHMIYTAISNSLFS